MIYTSIAHYCKETAHWLVENSFPSTPAIATATAFAAWYAPRVGMTYSQAIMTRWFVNKLGSISGHAIAPLFVPDIAPLVSSVFGFGAFFTTGLTLNLVSRAVFANSMNVNKSPAAKQALVIQKTSETLKPNDSQQVFILREVLKIQPSPNPNQVLVFSKIPNSHKVPLVIETSDSDKVLVVSENPNSNTVPVVRETSDSDKVPVISENPNPKTIPAIQDESALVHCQT